MGVSFDLNETVVKIGRAFNTRRNIVSYRNDVKRHNVVPLYYFLHLRTLVGRLSTEATFLIQTRILMVRDICRVHVVIGTSARSGKPDLFPSCT